jgi:chromosome partitioning protein
MAAIVLSFINQKGGCGKSSTCFHLAGHFAKSGLSTLLVGADPQGSLSQGFFGPARVEALAARETLAAVFAEDFVTDPTSLPMPTPFENLAVVCANQSLAPYNTPAPERAGLGQYALREFLAELAGYDVVLIDCPPNLYRCSWSAMVAADHVVIPVPPEDFGTQGLRVVHQAIELARRLNPALGLLGHVVTRRDGRLLIHEAYEQKLRQHHGDGVLRTVIPEAAAFKVSLACRRPVSHHGPGTRAALATAELGAEILARAGATRPVRRLA